MKTAPLFLSLSLLLSIPSVAFAQERWTHWLPKSAISQQLDAGTRSIIVNPAPTDFAVNLRLNKGGSNPSYRVGEPIQISLSTNRDAYVYLFSVEANGTVNLILPNRFSGGREFLRANEVRTFPPAGASYQLTISAPYGQAQVLAVATQQPLNLRDIASFQSGNSFAVMRVGKSGLSSAISRAIVVEEIPETQWVTSTAFYRVRP
ncbi:MAG: DUF4384 domain-containing protein [Cyanobacteriota bacterium]|nr:DUF4384 domain-containing protein [Cyanobacteriota bacterium]